MQQGHPRYKQLQNSLGIKSKYILMAKYSFKKNSVKGLGYYVPFPDYSFKKLQGEIML